MAALRRGQDALTAGEQLRRLEHGGLLHAARLQIAVVVQLADDAAHTVVAQAAGVVGGGDEAVAQRVHLGHGTDLAGVAEVVAEHAPGQAGAGGRLHGDDAVIRLAPEHLPHKGRDEAAQIGAAAGAADDGIGLDVVLLQRRHGLQTDNGLVQQHLIEDAAQHIAVPLPAGGGLHRLADGAAQRAGGIGEFRQNFSSHLGGVGGGRGHVGAVGTHDLPAEGLLLIGALDHEHTAIQSQISAGHAQGRTPLPGARLGGHAPQPLPLGIIRLRDGGVQLVAAGGVVALELIVDVGGGVQLLLQTVGANQRGRTVHLVEIPYLPGDGDIRGGIVQLLLHQLAAEHMAQLLRRHGLERAGVQQGRGLVGHIRTHVVPVPRQLVLAKVDLVGDRGRIFHLSCLLNHNTAWCGVSLFVRIMRNSRSAWRASPCPASGPPPPWLRRCPAAGSP